MPPQSFAELLILKGPLPASSVFPPLFPVFYISFLLPQNGQPFINISFQSPTFCSICCYWSYQCFIDIYFVPLGAGRDAEPSPLSKTKV